MPPVFRTAAVFFFFVDFARKSLLFQQFEMRVYAGNPPITNPQVGGSTPSGRANFFWLQIIEKGP
jgi:hypothetical protein